MSNATFRARFPTTTSGMTGGEPDDVNPQKSTLEFDLTYLRGIIGTEYIMLETLFGAAFFLSPLILMVWYGFHKFNQQAENRNKPSSVLLAGCSGLYIGSIIGGIAGFALPPIYYQLTKPEVLKDGQWGMVYLATLPMGMVIGASIGCALGVLLASRN